MTDELLSRAEGSILHLTLNRPTRRNALTPELARALADEIERVGDDGSARAVILNGAGGHFCVGLDLHWIAAMGPALEVGTLQRGLHDFQSAVLAIVRSPVPVIALLDGSVAGFGLDLALACDLRLATPEATFTSAFARMGLVPDGGSTLTLPILVGTSRALRLLVAGETLTAEAAARWGLVDEVLAAAALDAEAARLTERISAAAESSVRTIKRLCRASELGALEQALSAEGAAQLQALQGREFRDRLAAFGSKASRTGERP